MTAATLFPPPATPAPGVPDRVALSARVPADLRRRVMAEQARAGDETLSDTVRRLLEHALEHPPAELGDLDHAPRRHRHGPGTEREAAALAWPRAGTARRKLLGYLYACGDHGATSVDAVAAVGYSGARRLHDLKRAGWATVKRDDAGQPVRRATPRGARAEVHVLSAAARHRIESETRP